MSQVFLKKIKIGKVRHLKNIEIPLSETERKHLILTGKNGSGKTSIINELASFIEYLVSSGFTQKDIIERNLEYSQNEFTRLYESSKKFYAKNDSDDSLTMIPLSDSMEKIDLNISLYKSELQIWNTASMVCDYNLLRYNYKKGDFIIAFYPAGRKSKNDIPSSIEKVAIADNYGIKDTPGTKFIKYMVAQKAIQAFAQQKGDITRSQEIEDWFVSFEKILKQIFDDQNIKLDFDIDSFRFSILQSGHEPFDFNTMSDGYSAVFNIINDLIMRTEKKGTSVEGIVLIDEIETHLHLELQKSILPFLTGMFPNIQFIVTTHSPFILNSINDAVIFDLENKILVKNGMGNLPYEGIVEGYFRADRLSQELRTKFERYKELSAKENLTDEDWAEIGDLETYLDEIPDYLAIDITSEYSRLKLENENK